MPARKSGNHHSSLSFLIVKIKGSFILRERILGDSFSPLCDHFTRSRQSSYTKELFIKASGLGFVHCKSDLESKSDVGWEFFQSTAFSWVQEGEHPIPFSSSKFHAQDQGVLSASLSWPTTNKKTNLSSQIIKTARDSSTCLYF